MQYFNTLPKIIKRDEKGVRTLMTNLMARSSLIPSIMDNPAIYYKYDIQDGDTPEILAYKYYGESYRYWIILFANQINDPQWEWPLSYNNFQNYMVDKYGSVESTQSTIHHYEVTTTTIDDNTGVETSTTVYVDEDTYLNTQETSRQVYFYDIVGLVNPYDLATYISKGKNGIEPYYSLFTEQINGRMLGDINNSGTFTTADYTSYVYWAYNDSRGEPYRDYIENTLLPTISNNPNKYNDLISSKAPSDTYHASSTINVTKSVLTLYDYEYELNENKRSINILNSRYVNEIEQEFQKLMSQ